MTKKLKTTLIIIGAIAVIAAGVIVYIKLKEAKKKPCACQEKKVEEIPVE